MTLLRSIAIVSLVAAVVACVSQEKLQVSPPSAEQVAAGPVTQIALGTVTATSDAKILPTPYSEFYKDITPNDVANALKESLQAAGVFGDDATDSANVRVQILFTEIKGWGFPPMHGEIKSHFTVETENGDIYFDEVVESKISDSTFLGNVRVTSTRNRTISANIQEFIDRLRSNWPNYTKGVELRHLKLAEIRANLTEINRYYRVVADRVTIRQLPDADAKKVDSLPLRSVVHAIGSLPSGWIEVAREGRPIGWAHTDGLKAEGATGSGEQAKKPTYGEKPSIYVAFPKGGEQVAENDIDFIGYVSSHNRAERIEIRVNNRLVPLTRLWTDYEVQTKGLRGFPVRFRVPLELGTNKIDLDVLDQAGFLVNHSLSVSRIQIAERSRTGSTPTTPIAGLPARLEDLPESQASQAVTADNFIAVLGDWVKETAKSDYNKGNRMFDEGRFERAAYYFQKSIKTNAFSAAYFNLGITRRALGDETAARQAFEKACDLDEAKGCAAAKPST